MGEYVLTEKEAIAGKRFPDVIAISSNPMPSYHGKRFFFEHEGFDIPYRCAGAEEGRRAGAVGPLHLLRAGAVPIGPLDGPGHGHRPRLRAARRRWPPPRGVPPRKLDVKALQKLLVSQKAELRV